MNVWLRNLRITHLASGAATFALLFTVFSGSTSGDSSLRTPWRYFCEGSEFVVLGSLEKVHEDSLVNVDPKGWEGHAFSYSIGELSVEEVLRGAAIEQNIPVIWYSRSWSTNFAPGMVESFDPGYRFVEGQRGIWVLNFGGEFMWNRYKFTYVTADSLDAVRTLIAKPSQR